MVSTNLLTPQPMVHSVWLRMAQFDQSIWLCCTSCTKGRNVMPAYSSCFSLLLAAVNELLNSWKTTLTPIHFSVSVPVTSTLQSCCCYTRIDKIFHLMGTRGSGITRLQALSSVLSMPRALQSWIIGLLIPKVHRLMI